MMRLNTILSSAQRHTLMAVAAIALLSSAVLADDAVMTKEGKTTIVNTTTLASDVKGYKGTVPVKIYIKSGKIQKVEPLKNHETPRYFAKAKSVLAKFEGKSVSAAAKMDADAATGATFSTKALVKNVQAGAKYYKQHK